MLLCSVFSTDLLLCGVCGVNCWVWGIFWSENLWPTLWEVSMSICTCVSPVHCTPHSVDPGHYNSWTRLPNYIGSVMCLTVALRVEGNSPCVVIMWSHVVWLHNMPYAQSHYPFENKKQFKTTFPADFITKGINQTRGWWVLLDVGPVKCLDSEPENLQIYHFLTLLPV